MAPSPAPSVPELALPPSGRLLVDTEYLLEELLREAQLRETAQAGGPSGEPLATGPLMAEGGYGNSRRAMTFAHVRLEGLMRSWSASYVANQITRAYNDPSVAGILLEVNTGGGEVTAASMIRNVIADRSKPVVVYAHLAASGGMMATMDADEIVAAGRSARVGSIGVMRTLPNYMRRMYGEYFTDLYADTSPDKNRAFREWLKTGDTAEFQAELNALDAIFMEEMAKARPITPKTAQTTLAGGVWLAEEAKARGLVDSIGTMNYAITRLASYAANNPPT